MENASKALLIAGGVILTMLIVSLFLYAWGSITNYYKHQEEMIAIEDLTKFNSQFTNYERNDIKGYELLTLVNKVIDYNQRYSEAFDENKAVGNYMQFSPIAVEIILDADGTYTNRNKFTGKITVPAVANATNQDTRYIDLKDNPGKRIKAEITYDKDMTGFNANYRLFKNARYLQNNTVNQFKDDVLDVVTGFENDFGGSINAQNLVKSISTVLEGKVINYNGQPDDDYDRKSWYQKEYIQNRYKTLTGKILDINVDGERNIDDIRHGDNVKKILRYYEFVEFKKAEFNCIGVTYNQNTGRVASLRFEMK